MEIDAKKRFRRGRKMKIKISFSDEEREDARRLAEAMRQLFPRLGKVKESKKPEEKYGHIYMQDNRP
jgi:cell fate regulator YaaT (PSP1 superfamily)